MGLVWNTYSGIRVEYVRNTANTSRIQPPGRSFGIRGIRIHHVGCAGGRALLWGSCWRRAMSALALLRCAWAASSLHHPATRRPPFPCCRFSRLSVANSVGGAADPRVCEGVSAGLRRQACTLPGYGDEGIRSPTLRGAQLTPTAPTAAGPSRHDPRLAWPGVSHKDPEYPDTLWVDPMTR